jgi:hypothetical protein
MFTDRQRLEPHEVEAWISRAYPYPYFIVSITEREEPEKQRVRVTTMITGPNGETLTDGDRKAVYYALRDMPGMLQFSEDWTA